MVKPSSATRVGRILLDAGIITPSSSSTPALTPRRSLCATLPPSFRG
jgi:hypothetical protein